jgi:two-component system NarL family response regulator
MSEHRETADAIRVLIADDSPLFRRGISVVLATEEEICVIAEAENGDDAVMKAAEFAPDVVLMDVRMPRVNGIEAARAIRGSSPSTKIIMLTVSDEDDDLYEAIKAGANSYLLKEVSVEEVPEAIRAVVQGQSLISPSMASKLLNEYTSLARRADEKQQYPTPALTQRELEVLKLVAKGQSNREIGDELYISENTVKNHVRNILEKLHLHSRMEAVIYAVRERLLNIHDDVAG